MKIDVSLLGVLLLQVRHVVEKEALLEDEESLPPFRQSVLVLALLPQNSAQLDAFERADLVANNAFRRRVVVGCAAHAISTTVEWGELKCTT